MNLGPVGFECRPSEQTACTIEWDAEGRATLASTTPPVVLWATEENWRKFIAGEFNAMRGVLFGQIRPEGDVMRIVPFSRGFDELAEVARGAFG